MRTTTLEHIAGIAGNLEEPVGAGQLQGNITILRHFLFDFYYPIWDESKRGEFEEMFCRHFYKREIAFETVGLFKVYLQDVFQTEMPKFNKMFQLIESDFSLITDVDYSTTVDENVFDEYNGTVTSNEDTQNSGQDTSTGSVSDRTNTSQTVETDQTTNEDNTQRNAYSNTPEGSLTNVDNNSYLSDYRKVTDENERTFTGKNTLTGNSTDTSTSTLTETKGTRKQVNGSEQDIHANERKRTFTETVKGKRNNLPISEVYQKYMLEMESAYNLFYSMCDRKLFLMSWTL